MERALDKAMRQTAAGLGFSMREFWSRCCMTASVRNNGLPNLDECGWAWTPLLAFYRRNLQEMG